MQHIKAIFKIKGSEAGEMLIALLADAGYDGFEEKESELLAYIEEPVFNAEALDAIASIADTAYILEVVPAQNWNSLWEANFEPVVVAGFCTIRAHFHNIEVTTPYDIIITPKMSFGTGHHATTQLMIELMKDMELQGKTVLDFGAGTGVLAIMAEKLGASAVLAIDNDQWCITNALENTARNNCKHVSVEMAGDSLPAGKYDVILANINRHILLQYLPSLYHSLDDNGQLLMSGLLEADEEIMLEAASAAGFHFIKQSAQTGWLVLLFEKR